MTAADMLTTWVSLSPLERSSVREVYFRNRSITDTARRYRTSGAEVSKALQSAFKRVAAFVLDPHADETVPAETAQVVSALSIVAELPTSAWRWDTSREEMAWSSGLFALYGYTAGAVAPTIALHQSHKHSDDRPAVERLVLSAATERGPVVFPQRIVRTDGSVCEVVMRVVREPGPGEILTGRVVADLPLTR